MPETSALLDPDFLRRLERLSLISRRLFSGLMRGERRSPRRGSSPEFKDFREYSPGDDLRRVDWNSYARLDRLYLKTFVEEQDLFVYILFDVSASMRFGSPSKLDYARQLAAALGYVALCGGDQVGFGAFSEGLSAALRLRRGRALGPQVLHWIASCDLQGKTELVRSLKEYALRIRVPGLAVVISDLLAAGYQDALRALINRGCQIVLLHILEPSELHPELVGDLRLTDVETGEVREVTISRTALNQYRSALDAYIADITSFCSRHGITYVRITTDQDLEDVVLNYFHRVRLLK